MKYFTEEYKKALQNTGLVEGFDRLEEEDFDINLLYKQRESAYVERERELHDTPPVQEGDLFSDLELTLEDVWVADVDEMGNEVNVRHPESFEEWEKYKAASDKMQYEEYENRDPFDAFDARELFRLNFAIAVRDQWQLPAWVYEKVDARLIALHYLPRDLYKELETISKNNEKTIRNIEQQADEHLDRQDIPEKIKTLLELHDAQLLKIEEKKDTIYFDLVYGPASSMEGHHRIAFVEGEFLEKEGDLSGIDAGGLPGIYFSEQEIYHCGAYYEFHFLFDSYEEQQQGEYLYLTIRAKDLVHGNLPVETGSESFESLSRDPKT